MNLTMTDINQLKMTEQERKDLEQRIRRRESYERVKLATNKILTLLVEDGLTIKEGGDALAEVFSLIRAQDGRQKIVNPLEHMSG